MGKQYQMLNIIKNVTRYQKFSLLTTFFASCGVEIVVYWRNMVYHIIHWANLPMDSMGDR